MRLEIARTSDNFPFPGGRLVHVEFFTHLMYGSSGIVTFQFHQTAVDEIILYIVPGPGDVQARETKIKDAIRQIHEVRVLPGMLELPDMQEHEAPQHRSPVPQMQGRLRD